jgi:hypothetical protein
LDASPDITGVIKSRRMKWTRHVAEMGEMTSACKIVVGRPKEKRPLRILRHRWKDNTRMDLREGGWEVTEYIHDEVKSRLNLGNARYHSVQDHLFSHLISKYLSNKVHKTVILPVVLYGCKAWSLTLREEHRLRVF